MLPLNKCSKKSFTCENGKCIDIYKKCDMHKDCSEGEDEWNCFTVKFSSGYVSSIPPKMPLEVSVYFDIWRIGSVDILNDIIELSINGYVEWFDSQLDYTNLIKGSEETGAVLYVNDKVI